LASKDVADCAWRRLRNGSSIGIRPLEEALRDDFWNHKNAACFENKCIILTGRKLLFYFFTGERLVTPERQLPPCCMQYRNQGILSQTLSLESRSDEDNRLTG
jgi:hypothetical protein